jgi:hypothetical protein
MLPDPYGSEFLSLEIFSPLLSLPCEAYSGMKMAKKTQSVIIVAKIYFFALVKPSRSLSMPSTHQLLRAALLLAAGRMRFLKLRLALMLLPLLLMALFLMLWSLLLLMVFPLFISIGALLRLVHHGPCLSPRGTSLNMPSSRSSFGFLLLVCGVPSEKLPP